MAEPYAGQYEDVLHFAGTFQRIMQQQRGDSFSCVELLGKISLLWQQRCTIMLCIRAIFAPHV